MKRIKFFSCCWKATPTRAFNEFFTNFFNFGKFVKIRDFFCWGNEFSIYGRIQPFTANKALSGPPLDRDRALYPQPPTVGEYGSGLRRVCTNKTKKRSSVQSRSAGLDTEFGPTTTDCFTHTRANRTNTQQTTRAQADIITGALQQNKRRQSV